MVNLIIPISFTISFISFGFIAKWYVYPTLIKLNRKNAFIPILFFHSFRYIGLVFLIPGVTAEALDPRFSVTAAYGDLLTALLALISIIALKNSWQFAIGLVWVFNTVGTLDLILAVFQGLNYVPASSFGAALFIPIVIVPALLVSHCIVFVLLLKKDKHNNS